MTKKNTVTEIKDPLGRSAASQTQMKREFEEIRKKYQHRKIKRLKMCS